MKNKIIQGDCLEVMKKMPDKSVDLVLTDPPYGVRKEEKWDDKGNFIKLADSWIGECLRVTKSTLIWFCSGDMIPIILKNNRDNYHRILIWDKPVGSQYNGASHNRIWYSKECILVFSNDLSITKAKGKDSKFNYEVIKYRTIQKKIWGHPTTKPVGLMQELISHYSDKDDLILDPFLGSGTTAVAAKQLNRNFIGIEINPEYCEIARERLRQDKLL